MWYIILRDANCTEAPEYKTDNFHESSTLQGFLEKFFLVPVAVDCFEITWSPET